MAKTDRRVAQRLRRKRSIRKRITGSSERPRLCVFRSVRHIYAQVIDDTRGQTLASASSVVKGGVAGTEGLKPVDQAKKIGLMVAERCKAAGIEQVVFDRNGFKFHGRVKAIADGAREGGLQF